MIDVIMESGIFDNWKKEKNEEKEDIWRELRIYIGTRIWTMNQGLVGELEYSVFYVPMFVLY